MGGNNTCIRPKNWDNGFVVGGGVVFPVGIAINWFKS